MRIVVAGLLGGLVGNGILGALFTSAPVHGLLYDPAWQSRLFIEITPHRDVAVSVLGLVVLSVTHAWLFAILAPAIPGATWYAQGAFWGLAIWLMYWVFQEWFIYHTLLGEPLWLNLLELLILLVGSLAEGLIIALVLRGRSRPAPR